MKTAIVDTHALIWFLENNSLLGANAKKIMDASDTTLVISVIVLCELFFYLRKRKQESKYSRIYDDLIKDPRVVLVDIEPRHILAIPDNLELHDGLIVSTFLEFEQAVILTKDKQMKSWNPSVIEWN